MTALDYRLVPVMPASQRQREEVAAIVKEREEDVQTDMIDFSFYSCFLFEHLLFVKVVCVAERYFKEGKIQYELGLTRSLRKCSLALREAISVFVCFIVKCFTFFCCFSNATVRMVDVSDCAVVK